MARHATTDFLPSSSFCEFRGQRLSSASVDWSDSNATVDVLKFALAAPVEGEEGGSYDGPQFALSVDRYGGDGVSFNGGSGRCASLAGIQIKGVGQTALASKRAPRGHSYGGATMKDMVREAIWSRVVGAIAPYGSVRVYAVLRTGSRYVDQIQGDRTNHAEMIRAIALRDAPLRPAHYMRAAYFRVPQGLPNEECRMVNCVASLPNVLEAVYGTRAVRRAGGMTDISGGLAMFFERAAQQLAALYCNRIVHGGLSASNISLDGRLLDFGMTTSVSDFGPIITSGPTGHMMEQPTKFLRMLEPMFFYVEKFGPCIQPIPRKQISDHFFSVYETHKNSGLLRLTGIPRALLDSVESSTLDSLVRAFESIRLAGQREPFKLLSACPRYTASMPDRFSSPNIADVLAIARLTGNDRHRAITSYSAIHHRRTIEGFLSAYDAVLGFALSGVAPSKRQSQVSEIEKQSVCLTDTIRELQYPVLNKAINDVICYGHSMTEYIETVSRNAISRLALSDAEHDTE